MSTPFKLKDIKRVVAYGCSYTAGIELADADFIPHLTLEEINAEKKALGQHLFYSKYPAVLFQAPPEKKQLEYNRAWPKHLINYLELPLDYLNRSIAGSSMDAIVFAIEHDLHNGIINDDDLIVVGVTSADRILKINDEGSPSSLVLHDLDSRWTSPEFRKMFTMEIANDYWLLYNWYRAVKYIDMLSKTLNNRILQVYLHTNYQAYKDVFNVNNNEFLSIINSLKNIESILDKDLSFGKIEPYWNHKTEHGFYHPYEILHKNLAKILAEKIKEKYI
jgi:hypothetical protein